jgi:hypothetical protein
MCKAARRNCHFLSRAVRFLAGECGIRQFIDLGTGFPAQESVHKVAQEIAPEARVICVDNDPVVLTHARALGVPNDNVTVLAADIREPQTILGSSDVRELIDFSEPVAVLALAVLCCITDKEDPYRIVDAFREVIPAGSYIAITHIESTEQTRAAARVYDTANAPIVPRSRSELMRFFGGLDLVEPGIVSLSEWSPGFAIPNPRLPFLCGIGRKP